MTASSVWPPRRRVWLPPSRPHKSKHDWWIGPRDYWRLPATSASRRDWLPVSPHSVELVSGGAFVCRAVGSIRAVSLDEGPVVIEGRMMPFNEWAEIRLRVEGHFMERFAPGSLKRTIVENGSKVRALFEHGLDVTIGRQVVAAVDRMWEQPDGGYFRATLLDGVPALLVNGIRRGLYGSSVRFKPVQSDQVRSPGRSPHNPEGIPEVTVREAYLCRSSRLLRFLPTPARRPPPRPERRPRWPD